MDCGHQGGSNLLRTYPVYPSQPKLAVGYNFGSCVKQYSVEDLLKCWSLWHLFKLKFGPHWVVTEDNEIKLKTSSQMYSFGQNTNEVVPGQNRSLTEMCLHQSNALMKEYDFLKDQFGRYFGSTWICYTSTVQLQAMNPWDLLPECIRCYFTRNKGFLSIWSSMPVFADPSIPSLVSWVTRMHLVPVY